MSRLATYRQEILNRESRVLEFDGCVSLLSCVTSTMTAFLTVSFKLAVVEDGVDDLCIILNVCPTKVVNRTYLQKKFTRLLCGLD